MLPTLPVAQRTKSVGGKLSSNTDLLIEDIHRLPRKEGGQRVIYPWLSVAIRGYPRPARAPGEGGLRLPIRGSRGYP